MTKKEAEELAYILLAIEEVPAGGSGAYGPAREIANAALEAVAEVRRKFPRIREQMDEWAAASAN